MATLSVRLPNSIHEAIRTLAAEDDVSINQFVVSAVTEKLTALDTERIIESRAKRADRNKFLNVLNKVPDAPPVEGDM